MRCLTWNCLIRRRLVNLYLQHLQQSTTQRQALDFKTKETKRRGTRLANRSKSTLTMEQQATALLMKKCGILVAQKIRKCGILGEDESLVPEVDKFREEFVDPLKGRTVSSYSDVWSAY